MRNLFVLTLICLLTLSASIFGMEKWGKACRQVEAEIECSRQAFEKNLGRIIEGALAIGDRSTYDYCIKEFIENADKKIAKEVLQQIGAYFPDINSWKHIAHSSWKQGAISSISPKGKYIAVIDKLKSVMHILNYNNKNTVTKEICCSNDCSSRWSPCGKKIAIYASTDSSEDRQRKCMPIKIYRIKDRDDQGIELDNAENVSDLLWIDKDKIYVGYDQGKLEIYNAGNGTRLDNVDTGKSIFRIAEGSNKEKIVTIMKQVPRELALFTYKGKAVSENLYYHVSVNLEFQSDQLTWSPDGKHLIFFRTSGYSPIMICDVKKESLKQIHLCTPKWGHSFPTCLAWSPNGKKLAIGLNQGQVFICYDIMHKAEVDYRILTGHQEPIVAMAWPNNNSIVIGSKDGVISEWEFTGPFCSNNPLEDVYEHYKGQRKSTKSITYSAQELEQLCLAENGKFDLRKVKILLPYIEYRFGDKHRLVENLKMLLEEHNQHLLECSLHV